MLLEAALIKVPILCSDIRENKAVFNSEEVDYFKAGDVNDLALKINNYFNNRQAFKLKADKAYIRLLNNYQWKDIAMEYARVYNELIR